MKQYLGSTVVKELRGTESTRKSIQKLKKGERASLNEGTAGFNNSHHNVKRPLYISISYCGVKFIDINTQVNQKANPMLWASKLIKFIIFLGNNMRT